jgi:hypothetical protein
LLNLAIYKQILEPAEGLPDYVFDDEITSESIAGDAEAWSSLLSEFADEQESRVPHVPDAGISTRSCETHTPLRKFPGGAWQSLGGYLDYSNWSARDRFMELDQAIAATSYNRKFELEQNRETVPASKWFDIVTPDSHVVSEIINMMHSAEMVFEE